MKRLALLCLGLSLSFYSCNDDNDQPTEDNGIDLSQYFSIDFNNLPDYTNQYIPAYITKDNTGTNSITNNGATLGRILFYDKNLSTDNTISCSSCHQQENAFSDLSQVSSGVNGETGRHSMRLINSRFADESNFFWDERANTLEIQTTMPIQDHNEMGFSGTNGDPDFNDLIIKLEEVAYYPELFTMVYGDATITETRIQNALAQFIRSIQSFDSKYDTGRIAANNDNAPFANFSTSENNGKQLFLAPPTFQNGSRTGGGIGCAGCHRAPEFDIDPNSLNNGIIDVIGSTDTDLTVTRSPSLRDLFKPDGTLNGQLMHTGIADINAVIAHYNAIPANNQQLDPRLRPNGTPQQLNMTATEIDDLIAFLKTLSGTNVYTDTKWSDPFINQ